MSEYWFSSKALRPLEAQSISMQTTVQLISEQCMQGSTSEKESGKGWFWCRGRAVQSQCFTVVSRGRPFDNGFNGRKRVAAEAHTTLPPSHHLDQIKTLEIKSKHSSTRIQLQL